MSNIIGYKNQLWKVIYDFKYTGTDQPFTLSPGAYLFICKGAPGGMHVGFESTCIRELGGIAYGIIDIDTTKTFHAVVGGNGGDVAAVDPAIENPGIGGFNGGAPGGQPTERYRSGTYYTCGAGGGGATDIRLLPYDPDEYPTYDEDGTFHEPEHPCEMLYDTSYDASTDDPEHKFYQLEYVQTNGNHDMYGTANMTTSFRTDYIPKRNTKVRYEGMITSYGFTGHDFFALFGARYTYMQNEYALFLRAYGANNPTYSRNNRYESVSGDTFPFDQHVVIECYRDKAEWFVNGESKGSITVPGYYDQDGTAEFVINATHSSNGDIIHDPSMKQHFFRFTISEIENDVETIVRDYVPAERVSDGNIGIFDTVNRTFLPHHAQGTLIKTPYKRQHPSIDSRIMVAGGGGGTINNGSIDMPHGIGGGGGVSGGLLLSFASYQYEPNFRLPTNQSTGYTQGYAIPGTKRVSWNAFSVEGTGGGGGGWYSGYSSQTKANVSYSTYNGTGGSGYVLTETSYKPEGYHPSSEYYFHDSFMSQAQSHEGEIIIAQRVSSFAQGDVIEFPCVGEACAITLPSAAYKIRCYGADGGYRYFQKHAARGGYSEGEITLTSPTDIFVHVGGASHPRWNYGGRFWADTHANALINVPTLSYNGGGISPNTNTFHWTSGGGGTDVRIGVDDLYHRLIVAGGGGSEGGFNNGEYGGAGGGETGGVSYGPSGYNNGPGTQTGSPSTYPAVAGSFGQGGPSIDPYGAPGGGGAGGGGWYGGSGTQPSNRNDTNKGGAGGSGYVLTETSYKPEGYALGEQYYMTNALTSTGGNTLPLFQSKVVIEVQRMFKTIICKDIQGYKYFDAGTSQWLLIEPQPIALTKAVFDQIVPSVITSDEGLEDTYTVYVYDEEHSITSIGLDVVPLSQTISQEIELHQMISDIVFDTESYDDNEFDVKVLSHDRIDDDTVKINISVDKLENTDRSLKLYNAQLQTHGNYGSHTYINPDGKRDYYTYDKNTNQIIHDRRKFEYRDPEQYRDPVTGLMTTAQWLLPVGKGDRLPIHYRNDVIDYGVTNIYNTCMYEYHRTIYIAMLVRFNNDTSQTYLIIKGLNFITAELTELARIPWSNIGTSYRLGSIIVDDSYYWITQSYADQNQRYITRIDRTTLELVRTPSTSYNIRAYGKMCLSDTDGRLLVATENGLEAYDPIYNQWSRVATWAQNNNLNDMCIGKSIIVITVINSRALYVIDRETYEVTILTLPISTNGTPVVCYDGKGTFYIAQSSYMITFDEATQTFTDQYVMSVITNPSYAVYVNGAVFVTMSNSSRVAIYRTDVRNYIVTNLPWILPTKGESNGTSEYGLFLPCATNGYFVLLYRTLCVINYTGTSKYDMGYKYDRTIVYYNTSNIEHMEYDDRFVTVTDTFTEVHNGTLTYTFSAYDANHIAHVEITKNDTYRYLRNVSLYYET